MKANEYSAEIFRDYRKTIWRPFLAAVRAYRLIEEGDRIAVCVSGGKDSMLLSLCMLEWQRRSPIRFEAEYLCMDPGYTPEHRRQLSETAQMLGIPLSIFDADIFEALDAMGGKPCPMCAKMRRGTLYREAQRRGCNKIALGHHADDVIETLLMSMLYAGEIRTMPPIRSSDSVEGMRLIRPLYRVWERDILAWRDAHGLSFLNCACRFTSTRVVRPDGSSDSKRLEVKQLIDRLRAVNPNADRNLLSSVHNVRPDELIGWKANGRRGSYLFGLNETTLEEP